MVSYERRNIRTSSVPSVKPRLLDTALYLGGRGKAQMNWAFKVIQGHFYWCRQKSRTLCGRNVKMAKSSISATPPRFDDAPARNAFEYLQMMPETRLIDLYFATDSIGLSLLFSRNYL